MLARMPFRRSNTLALAILVYLAERPRHPYEIAADMRARHQHESIKLNYGSLYSVIASLEQHGLIEAGQTEREGKRPERTIYSITPDGRRECADWLSELLSSPDKEYHRFEAALSLLGALPPDEVLAMLRQRLSVLDAAVARYRRMLDSRDPAELPRLFILEAEYAAALVDAERAFVAGLVQDIEAEALEGLDEWREWSS
jgi:DNA-binding PadR family transcriptional regulator